MISNNNSTFVVLKILKLNKDVKMLSLPLFYIANI